MPKIIENLRDTILSVAKNIVIEEDYDRLTMRKVSEESGIAVGTIYNYFPTKQALMIQLLEDYWYEYLIIIDEIDHSETDFYGKLSKIFIKLEEFLNTFMEVWLKNSRPGYDDDSRSRKDIFTEKLIVKLEEILTEAEKTGEINLILDSHELANFLLMNFIMMAQMKQFKYENFKKIIIKLFQ